ncbi:hypothetical protein [Flavobacterium sp. 14A]|uniref:hypothetical protein n=1 Tax=Flavobacterium sp. 14A TaxID=2735896 RepID=UPI00156F609E|nr:hypothetical protein [Flavobacterium sp. 14A]NRT12562.1 putative SprT family Zn-dependent metalloprotease [Flavobacterium sp. 14A]
MSRLIYFYTKESLEKARLNPEEFTKVLKKAIKNLLPYEIEHLGNWLHFYTSKNPELKPCLVHVKK